jgi:hypothetical protein
MAEQRRKISQQRQQAAQRRREQAEQQARLTQQQREQEQSRLAQAQANRRKAEQEARIQNLKQKRDVTIKKGDTPESLALRFGTTPQAIADQTKGRGMKPGTIQTYDVPAQGPDVTQPAGGGTGGGAGGGQPDILQPSYLDQMLGGAEPQGPQQPDSTATAGFVMPGMAGVGIIQEVANGFLDWIKSNVATSQTDQGTILDPFGISGFASPVEGREQTFAEARSDFFDVMGPTSFNAIGPEIGPEQDIPRFQQGPFGDAEVEPNYMLGEPKVPPSAEITNEQMAIINDRKRDMEIRDSVTRHYDALDDAQRELSSKVAGLRYTHQALAYAWTTGDMSLRPNYLTEWEFLNLSPDQQMMVQDDLGYVWDGEKFVPQDLPEEGYGMGGFDMGGFGGGVGEYKQPIYTGARRGTRQGGESRGTGGRLTAGYTPASHWRI